MHDKNDKTMTKMSNNDYLYVGGTLAQDYWLFHSWHFVGMSICTCQVKNSFRIGDLAVQHFGFSFIRYTTTHQNMTQHFSNFY